MYNFLLLSLSACLQRKIDSIVAHLSLNFGELLGLNNSYSKSIDISQSIYMSGKICNQIVANYIDSFRN